MRKPRGLPTIVLLVVLSCVFPQSLVAQSRLPKKIIEYGWDVPYPGFIRDHIREMEKRPFEGILFRTEDFNHALTWGQQ
jgi:hypothetical protein